MLRRLVDCIILVHRIHWRHIGLQCNVDTLTPLDALFMVLLLSHFPLVAKGKLPYTHT